MTASGDAVDGATDAVQLEAEQGDDEGDSRPEAHGAVVDAWPHDGGLDELQGDEHADDEEPGAPVLHPERQEHGRDPADEDADQRDRREHPDGEAEGDRRRQPDPPAEPRRRRRR